MVRALALQARGQEFESPQLHHLYFLKMSEFFNGDKNQDTVYVFYKDLLKITCDLIDCELNPRAITFLLEEQIQPIKCLSNELASLVCKMADNWSVSLQEVYANRIEEIGSRNHDYAQIVKDKNPSLLIRQATQWNEFQKAQKLHDIYFHPQVLNWTEVRQFGHHCLHLIKLNGHLVEALENDNYGQFKDVYLADLLAFSIILSNLSKANMDDFGISFDSIY